MLMQAIRDGRRGHGSASRINWYYSYRLYVNQLTHAVESFAGKNEGLETPNYHVFNFSHCKPLTTHPRRST